ncbi:MAG: alpha-hydroxy-acid oxidizing protein, partial [Polyangiaceae bacterium]|nr:alpha-hydroxy-acid oxidizing protein [Polyangiaceae bacterium]
ERTRQANQVDSLGAMLREWGIPTASSVVFSRRAGLDTVIATGGIRTGLDVAKAIALGASVCGMAWPVLDALSRDGSQGVRRFLERVERELRTIMLLIGAAKLSDLGKVPKLLSPELKRWLD